MKPPPSRGWRIAVSLLITVTALACLTLIGYGVGWTPDLWELVAGLVLLLAGGIWLGITVIGVARYRQVWGWLLAPVLIVVGTGLLLTYSVPLRATVAISDGNLRAYETHCTPTDGTWVGVLRVIETREFNDACHFYVSGEFLNSRGLARFSAPPPEPPPGASGAYRYTHFTDDWYTFVEDW